MVPDSAEKYLAHRAVFRQRVADAFQATDADASVLIASMGDLVAKTTLFLSGKNLSAYADRLYIADLFVSFCRTHFIAVDLVVQGELIEGATLIRKQMELMARVREMSEPASFERLIGKTPNVRHLQEQLRRLYGEYSAIAHSATPVVMRLLGRMQREEMTHTPIYPEFDTDAYVALNHLAWLCVEFHLSAESLLPIWFPELARPDVAAHFEQIARLVIKAQIKRADRR